MARRARRLSHRYCLPTVAACARLPWMRLSICPVNVTPPPDRKGFVTRALDSSGSGVLTGVGTAWLDSHMTTTNQIHTTGTRKQLGMEYGTVVTLFTSWAGTVTGTVVKYNNGWALADHDSPNHFPVMSPSTKVTRVTNA